MEGIMKMLKRPFPLIAAGVIVVVVVILAGYLLGPLGKRGPWQVTIATGTPGGTYSTLGAEFARILEELPDSPITDATAINTAASVENIELLAKDIVDIGFVMKPAISNATVDQLAKLSTMARLYMDVVQIVVRKDADIRSLTDLNAKKVYVGKEGSGTKIVAEKILDSLQVFPSIKVKEGSYREASRMLVSEELDAAFFVAGTPTEAVKMALESGKCDLLDLGDSRDKINIPDLSEADIPRNTYENQTTRVRTVGAGTFLLCRKDLDANMVILIEYALFNNLDKLLLAHAKAQDIKFESAFNREKLPKDVELHPGAARFQQEEEKKLLIVTGALNGKYYDLGKTIKSLLEPYGIHARVSHTDGSVENLRVLDERAPNEKPTLAIIQFDVALASRDPERSPYRVPLPKGIDIPGVKDMRRIATLHPEAVHIMVRRDKLAREQESQPTFEALKNLRVCLGPKESGTRLLAHAILAHHNINPKSRILLPVPDMVDRIHGGEIDAGFFVSYVPSAAVKTLLDNVEIKLLSLDPKRIVKMVGPALDMTEIPQYEYACQLEGEPAVKTIATRAVLVTRENMPKVYKITKAIFEGEAFLDIKGGVETMKKPLPSLHLHPDTRKYFRKVGIIPGPTPINWFRQAWYTLACLMILTGGFRGILHLMREGTARKRRREIHRISVEASEPDSVALLKEIRKKILRDVQKKWQQRGKIDEFRRRELEILVADKISEAHGNLTRAIAAEIHSISTKNELDSATRLERYSSLEERIRNCFEKGELDESQYSFLMKILEDHRRLERH